MASETVTACPYCGAEVRTPLRLRAGETLVCGAPECLRRRNDDVEAPVRASRAAAAPRAGRRDAGGWNAVLALVGGESPRNA